MKVLHLTSNLHVSGISNYVVSLLKGLRRRGVSVFCASGGGELVYSLEREGIRHFSIPVNTRNELHPQLLFALSMLRDIIREHDITHIHAHTRVTQVLAALLRLSFPITYVSTCHGFFHLKPLRRCFSAWGDQIIAISDAVREHLVNDFAIPRQKIVVIPNGIDSDVFQPRLTVFDKQKLRDYYDIDAKSFIIGSVSKLEQTKGYQHLIESVPAVLERSPSAKIILIGDGKYRSVLQQRVKKLGVEKAVFFLGRIEDVSFFLEVIDVFVLPSIWGEGFGLSILEAMAFGKPIVATNVGNAYTLVRDGDNGFLVRPRDPAALSAALVSLVESPVLVKRMGARSMAIANSEFSLGSVVDAVLEVYTDVARDVESRPR